MGPGRLWRSAGAHLLAEVARILWSGALVARRQAGGDSRGVAPAHVRPLAAAMKTYLYFIGKPRDAHANALAEDYAARAARFAPVEMREIRPERTDLWVKHPAARKVFLDPAGKPMDPAGFAALVSQAEMEGRALAFLAGG